MKFFLVAIVLIAQMNYFVHCKYNLLRLLNKYQQLTEDMADDSMMQLQNVQKEFSFTNCGSASDPLQFKSLSIKPQPLHIPGPLTISTDISLLKNLSSPVTVALKIVKQVGPFSVTLPCVDNVGSCTYKDVCSMLPKSPSECPDYIVKQGLNCQCPIRGGDYSVQDLTLSIETKEPIPSGVYQITAIASTSNSKNRQTSSIGCLFMEVTLK